MKQIVIAAGGTGGHLFPGLAVGEVLLRQGHAVTLIVSEKEIDAVATQGRTDFRIEKVAGVGLSSKTPSALIRFVMSFARGLGQCRRLMRELRPSSVLAMGGFTSLAPLLAGRGVRARTFVHESNAIPGRANRLNARFCTSILIGFEECAQFFPKGRCIVTGTPVRSSLGERLVRQDSLQTLGLKTDRQTLLVMGGSQGAHGVNMALANVAPALGEMNLQVIHLTGRSDESTMRERYAALGVPAFVAAFHHDMRLLYSAADLSIGRSGASSLTETSHFALPSILIPYPFAADDHQTANARIYEKAGAAMMVHEREVVTTPAELGSALLLDKIRACIQDAARLSSMSARSAEISPRDAAARVAQIVLSEEPA